MIKIVIVILILSFSSSLLFAEGGEAENKDSLGKLLSQDFVIRSDPKQQLCEQWTSLDDRRFLLTKEYANSSEYKADFAIYVNEVLKKVKKSREEGCQILIGDKYYLASEEEAKISPLNMSSSRLTQVPSLTSWHLEHVQIQHLPYQQNITFESSMNGNTREPAHFEAQGERNFALMAMIADSRGGYLRLSENLYTKKIHRRGQVGRKLGDGEVYNETRASYLFELKKMNRWKMRLGPSFILNHVDFIDERGENNFNLELLSTLSPGIFFNSEIDLFRLFEWNAYVYRSVLMQKARNNDINKQEVWVLGSDLVLFPSLLMTYFVGAQVKLQKSEFLITDLFKQNKTILLTSYNFALLWGIQF